MYEEQTQEAKQIFSEVMLKSLQSAKDNYGNVIAVKNELHSVLSKENLELFQTVVNVGVGSLLMVSAFWLVIFYSVVRDVKKLETKIVLMELMYKNKGVVETLF